MVFLSFSYLNKKQGTYVTDRSRTFIVTYIAIIYIYYMYIDIYIIGVPYILIF